LSSRASGALRTPLVSFVRGIRASGNEFAMNFEVAGAFFRTFLRFLRVRNELPRTPCRNCLKSGSSKTSTANLVGIRSMRWAERSVFRRPPGPHRGWVETFQTVSKAKFAKLTYSAAQRIPSLRCCIKNGPLRGAGVLPILPAALAVEPVFVLLTVGHGGAFKSLESGNISAARGQNLPSQKLPVKAKSRSQKLPIRAKSHTQNRAAHAGQGQHHRHSQQYRRSSTHRSLLRSSGAMVSDALVPSLAAATA
jgi:hypothetical protein